MKRTTRTITCLSTAVVLSAGCTDTVPQQPADEGTAQARAVAEGGPAVEEPYQIVDPQRTDFLPLNGGNTWTYLKQVPVDRRAFFERTLRLKKRQMFVTTGQSVGASGAVRCTETYTVNRNVRPDQWEIGLSVSPRPCGDLTHGPRDGRYQDALRIVWLKQLVDAPGQPEPGKEVLGYIKEKLVYDRNALGPGWRDEVSEPVEDTRVVGVIWKVLPAEGRTLASIELRSLAGDTQIRASDTLVSLNTPAGSFSNCVETREDVSRNNGRDLHNPSETGWIRSSFFCSNVGLVKEVERNRAGDLLYSMELQKYQVQK